MSNLDVSLTFIEDVGPGHEAGIAPVVLLCRVVVIGFASEVRNACFLRDQTQFGGRLARPGAKN